jgi:hypothetical protein
MTRCVLWGALLALLTGGGLVSGTPLDTKTRAVEFKLEPYRSQLYWRQFQGGKLARVIAVGKTARSLGLYVFDPDGNCVAHDDDLPRRTPDDAAVEWVPPRTGQYTLEVKGLGRHANPVLLTVREQDREEERGKPGEGEQ